MRLYIFLTVFHIILSYLSNSCVMFKIVQRKAKLLSTIIYIKHRHMIDEPVFIYRILNYDLFSHKADTFSR